MKSLAFAGNDVHKNSVRISVYRQNESEPFFEKTIATDKGKVQKVYAQLAADYEIRACYEASGCGYVFHRWLKEIGVKCDVIAPGSIPQQAGRRIKTDHRDARILATQYKAGTLSIVHIPTETEHAVRGISRMREQFIKQRHQTRQFVLKFLAERGVVYDGGANWTQKHRTWLNGLELAGESDQFALQQYCTMLEMIELQVRTMDKKLEELAFSPAYVQQVNRLRCFRGIDTITAIGLITETIDFKRFASARHYMAYLGLVPSLESSGETRWLGGITRRGNPRIRRLLVEAAWHYRHKPWVSEALRKRQEGQDVQVVAHAFRAQQRLHGKYMRLLRRGKCSQKIVVSLARELSGFIWSVMKDVATV